MPELKLPLDTDAIRERLAAVDGPWFCSDVEGDLAIWREAALRDVTRDEHGDIDGYRTPGHYPAVDLVAEWDLDTWDEGDDPDDDLRRARARFIAQAPADIDDLLEEVERLRQKDRDAMVWEARLAGHAWTAVNGGNALAAALSRLADEWTANAEAVIGADDERDPHQHGVADALTTCAAVVRSLLGEHSAKEG